MTSSAPKKRATTSAMIASLAEEGQKTRPAPFGHALVAAAREREDILGLTADLAKYTDLHVFAQAYLDRFYQMGMAEQLLMASAAGMAREGFTPVATTYAVFASRRAYDFICLAIAEERLNVKIACALPGLTTGYGPSHQATEDLAMGSAVAEASALGAMLIPWQKREGYPAPFAAAVTASSSVIAGLIPPSIPLIIYATVSNTSIASLFIAGILPGLMLALGLMTVCYLSGRLRGFPIITPDRISSIRVTFAGAIPALVMPVCIVILLRAGIATPTEISVVAVAYALLISSVLYRDLTLRGLLRSLSETVIATGVVMIVIMGSSLAGYILTAEHIPQTVAAWALDTLGSLVLVILAINALMLLVGMFLDLPAAILLLGATLVGIAQAIGLDPVQLGIMMAVNLSIGLFTPPVGTTLFIASSIAREPIGRVARELLPFYLVALIVLGLVSYVPAFTIY